MKDKKIRQLETELTHQKKLIEELRLELVSKQLDRDNLKSQMISKSFSPLLFLNDHVTIFQITRDRAEVSSGR